jgi:hypothetical protein
MHTNICTLLHVDHRIKCLRLKHTNICTLLYIDLQIMFTINVYNTLHTFALETQVVIHALSRQSKIYVIANMRKLNYQLIFWEHTFKNTLLFLSKNIYFQKHNYQRFLLNNLVLVHAL